MLADVADYGEWQSGRNLAGTQMAVNGFSNKVSSACASAIVAGLLAWGAYDGTVAVQSSKRIWQFYLHLLFFRLLQIS